MLPPCRPGRITTYDDASDEDVLAARRARRELRARLAELRDAAAAPAPEPEPGPKTYAEAWEQADTVGRSRLLAAALDHVVVLPGTRGGTPPPVDERVKITAPPSDYV